jgi:exonuclease III
VIHVAIFLAFKFDLLWSGTPRDMSLISWNCRGLGSPNAIPNLKYLVRFYKPAILFLNETLVQRNKIEDLRYVFGFSNCFSVDRVGRSGGLALFWHSSINCQIIDYSQNHITAEIIDNEKGPWRLTGYYGYPNGGRRRASWDLLRQLSNQTSLPWCIYGDFNDIMDASEKRGRTTRSNWLINGFRQAVIDSGLTDVPMEGYPFTWFKSLGTPRAVEERLDRALANTAWFNFFPSASLDNLVAPTSDHCPIMLNCQPFLRHQRVQRGFRFENAWRLEANLTR